MVRRVLLLSLQQWMGQIQVRQGQVQQAHQRQVHHWQFWQGQHPFSNFNVLLILQTTILPYHSTALQNESKGPPVKMNIPGMF